MNFVFKVLVLLTVLTSSRIKGGFAQVFRLPNTVGTLLSLEVACVSEMSGRYKMFLTQKSL